MLEKLQRATSSSRAGRPRGGHTGSATSQGGSFLPVQRRGSVERPTRSSTSIVESARGRLLEQSLLEFWTRLEPVELDGRWSSRRKRPGWLYFIPCSPIDDAKRKIPLDRRVSTTSENLCLQVEEVYFSTIPLQRIFLHLSLSSPPLPLWFFSVIRLPLYRSFVFFSFHDSFEAWIRGWFFFFLFIILILSSLDIPFLSCK